MAEAAETEPQEEVEAPEAAEEEDSPEDIALAARLFRWKPADQYKGPPEKFLSAKKTLERSYEIMRDASFTRNELGRTKDKLNRVVGQFAQLENRLNTTQMSDVEARMDAAFEAGDAKAFAESKKELTQLRNAASRTQPNEAPAFSAFKAENEDWFDMTGSAGNEEATAYAISLGPKLGQQFGGDTPEMYAELRKRVAKRFPEISGEQTPPATPARQQTRPPQVGRGGGSGRAPEGGAKLTVATMSKDQRRMCEETGIKPEDFIKYGQKYGAL